MPKLCGPRGVNTWADAGIVQPGAATKGMDILLYSRTDTAYRLPKRNNEPIHTNSGHFHQLMTPPLS